MRKKLPYIEDKDLYAAVMRCINDIENGQTKAQSVKNSAQWKGVKQSDIKPYIETYFPQSFFDKRKKIPKSYNGYLKRSDCLTEKANSSHFKSI